MASHKQAVLMNPGEFSLEDFRNEVLHDYRIVNESRQASLLGRKEVLSGKAKFGVFGDGKEVAQIALAKTFMPGDFRSGYYRDQTWMFASGISSVTKLFAQLYAHADMEAEPFFGGRAMNGHYCTRSLNSDGSWKVLTDQKNSSADVSPTANQMLRLVGLAYASKLYRLNPELHRFEEFSIQGNEVAFGTIGDASTSEGYFFEAINAAGVLQIPMAVSVWDDGYGISVPISYQTTKQSISEALKGFQRNEKGEGFMIYTCKGWDYPGLCKMYEQGIALCREKHIPVLFHIQEMTQPQGHSTSGSHERYKSEERLAWEDKFDCIRKMREWILSTGLAEEHELEAIEEKARQYALECRNDAWKEYITPLKEEAARVAGIIDTVAAKSAHAPAIAKINAALRAVMYPERKEMIGAARKTLRLAATEDFPEKQALVAWVDEVYAQNKDRYHSHLYSQSEWAAVDIKEVKPLYDKDVPWVDGREVLLANFDENFKRNPLLVAFGEDVGKIGDVNQAFAGLQAKYGELRITDTGIREATIVGQAIGMALRGLRPIAEIEYLDYLIYAIEPLSDDVALLRYRTCGGQKVPLIVRTRGHRLEGIFHTGSPMGMIIHSLRGMYVLVPRNMTQAAGFYNTMLASDDPALIIEPLNGYRIKEKLPSNPAEYRVPIGVPDFLHTGDDVTIVTYGSCCRIAEEAVQQLAEVGISCELIDVQTLIPFDIHHVVSASLKKTNKILFLDEDVPGGASAFMMQQVLEVQGGFPFLDAPPRTLTATEHRTPYGTDGDYFSKPSTEAVFDAVYGMMREYAPDRFPAL